MGDSKPSVSKLDKMKKIIRSLVNTSKAGLTSDQLNVDYRELEGKDIPFHEFGYTNLNTFLKSIPDTVKIIQSGNKLLINRIVSEESKHITKLVDEQNSSKRRGRKNRSQNRNGFVRQMPRPPVRNTSNIPSLLQLNIPPPPGYCKQQGSNVIRSNPPFIWQYQEQQLLEQQRIRYQQTQRQIQYQQNYQQLQQQQQLRYQQQLAVNNSWFKRTVAQPNVKPPVNLQSSYKQQQQQQELSAQQAQKTVPHPKDQPVSEKSQHSQNQVIQNGGQGDRSSIDQKCTYDEFLDEFDDLTINDECTSDEVKQQQQPLSAQHFQAQKTVPHPKDQSVYSRNQFFQNNTDKLVSQQELKDDRQNTYDEFLDEFDDLAINDECTRDEVDQNGRNLIAESESNEYSNETDNSFNSNCVSSSLEKSDSANSLDAFHNNSLSDLEGDNELCKDVAELGTRFHSANVPREFKIGLQFILIVSEVTSPHKFWFHTIKIQEELTCLMTNIEQFYASIKANKFELPLEQIRPYEACVVLYNNVWHRAEVLEKITDDVVKVELVDYGTKTKINLKNMKLILKEFAVLPKQAIQGSLNGIRPIGKNWTHENTTSFVSMIEELFLYANITKLDKEANITYLELIDTNKEKDISINEQLVKMNHACYY